MAAVMWAISFTSMGCIRRASSFPRRRVILSAAAGDLDRAEQRGQASGGLPVPALLDAVQQAGAIGIAASGRVEQRGRLGAGDDDLLAVGVDGRAFAAAGDDERTLATGVL